MTVRPFALLDLLVGRGRVRGEVVIVMMVMGRRKKKKKKRW
jgi:ABC-type phosphate transport system permease subunit